MIHTLTEREDDLTIRRDALQLLKENAWAIINHEVWKEQWAQLQRDEAALLRDMAEVQEPSQQDI